jgi:protein-L-isoaspartate O-methyltransferase
LTETARVTRRQKPRETGERLPDLVYHVEKTPCYFEWWDRYATDNLRKVYEANPIQTFRRSACFDGLAQFLMERKFTGKRVLEIGTLTGTTAIILARLFDEVLTIDIEPNGIKRGLAQSLGIGNVRFFDVKSNEEKARLVRSLKFDAAYVDGNHQDDTETDFELVKHCGLVLFHECWPLQPPVWNLVQSLPREQVSYGGRTHALWDARK